MKSVIAMNPFQCRMWDMHDRLETQVSEESCKKEIESFSKYGQLIPVVGRPLRQDPTHKVELIYGARRLFVARHLNVSLLVELREMTDREALVFMDIENRHRTDISPYERGLSYARALRARYFRSQDELARALKISAPQVSRLLKLAQLPSVIIDAFNGPASICEGWGLEIAHCLEDPTRRAALIRAARKLARVCPRPPGQDVFRQMMAAVSGGRRVKRPPHDEVVTDARGRPLFRIRRQRNSVAFLVPSESAPCVMENVREAIARALAPRVLEVGVAHGGDPVSPSTPDEHTSGSSMAPTAS